MSSNGMETNAVKVYGNFANFTLKEIDKCTSTALGKAAAYLVKETKREMLKDFPAAAHRDNYRYIDTILDAPRYSKYKKNDSSRTVHIMGGFEQNSQTYKARFFETGTDDRKTKKGYNRGHIKPLYFFRDAVKKSGNDVEKIIDEQLEKTINKINETKF